jgi:hypothetical protein
VKVGAIDGAASPVERRNLSGIAMPPADRMSLGARPLKFPDVALLCSGWVNDFLATLKNPFSERNVVF